MNPQLIQSILALVGIGLVACTLRWQIGFCILDSIKVGWKMDFRFALGLILIAQRFLF